MNTRRGEREREREREKKTLDATKQMSDASCFQRHELGVMLAQLLLLLLLLWSIVLAIPAPPRIDMNTEPLCCGCRRVGHALTYVTSERQRLFRI